MKNKVHCLKSEMIAIGELKPNPRNPNTHPEEQLRLLAKNIKELGWRHPITVSKRSGFIVSGHARFYAAKALGCKTVPVNFQDFKDEAEEYAVLIADNRLAELAERDMGMMKDLMSDLDAEMGLIDKELTGYIEKDWEALMTSSGGGSAPMKDAEPQIDQADELLKKYGVKLGQIWELGEHRILCGDCGEIEHFKKLMDLEKATLVFTDPLYGVSISAKNNFLNSFHQSERNLKPIELDNLKPDELYKVLLNCFQTIKEFCADNASIFVCAPQGGRLGMMMMMMMKDAGLEVKHVLNWVKNSPTFSLGRLDYEYQHEPILFTWIKTHKRKKEGKFQTSVWLVDKPMKSKEHPTMKPVELPENAVLNHTDDGDIVLDPFLGSGTTLIACENLKRKCRGIEIDPGYVAVCLQRFQDAFGKEPKLAKD